MIIINGSLPIVRKEETMPAFVYNPNEQYTFISPGKNSYFVSYWRVKKLDVENWIDKMKKNPPNPDAEYNAIFLTYLDEDGGEPRFGASIFQVGKSINEE